MSKIKYFKKSILIFVLLVVYLVAMAPMAKEIPEETLESFIHTNVKFLNYVIPILTFIYIIGVSFRRICGNNSNSNKSTEKKKHKLSLVFALLIICFLAPYIFGVLF
ncbi:hypothetical protein [Lentibacillus salinarum]